MWVKVKEVDVARVKEGEERRKKRERRNQENTVKNNTLSLLSLFHPYLHARRNTPVYVCVCEPGVKEGKKVRRAKTNQPFLFRELVLRTTMICADCKFFQSLEPWQRSYLPSDEQFGECRLDPPIASVQPEHRTHQLLAVFPTVEANDWCGQFAPRAAKSPACCNEEANAAFDAALAHDATDAPVAASACGCDRRPE